MRTIAQLRKDFYELKNSFVREDDVHIRLNDTEAIIYASDKNKIYCPNPTGKLFHADNTFVQLIMGPYGSGKSTICVNKIVQHAISMPKWHNGRRRSKCLIIRNTSGELQSTTLQTWLQWFGELGSIRKRQKPLLTYEHTFNDGNGIIELELVFIALDRDEDIRKLKSIEATMAYINELSEVPRAVLNHLKGRVNRRYPSKEFCSGTYWSGIICDTNPPSDSHWIYEDFESKQTPDYKVFYQPPGLIKNADNIWEQNPNADNVDNLAPDYYPKLASGQTEEFIKVFCLGKYGVVGLGKIVYPEFNSDCHAVNDIEAMQGEPLYAAFDFGLMPACIVIQISARGQIRALKEFVGTDIGLRTFAESVVIPGIAKEFPYCKLGNCVGDPSGNARDQILEEMSCISELNSLGIKTQAARTNEIESRIAAVRFFLNRMIDGKPAFILSKKGCPVLYNAFVRDYVYKQLAVSGEARYKDKPEKNMASHISDALQYICLEFAADRVAADKTPKSNMDNWNNPVMRMN